MTFFGDQVDEFDDRFFDREPSEGFGISVKVDGERF